MKKVVLGLISRNNQGIVEYLLLSSKKDFGEFTGLYYPPGGHMEEDEDEKTALIREIKEELGVDANPTEQIAVTPGDIKDQITYWWSCDCTDHNFNVSENEIADVRWHSVDEIKVSNKLWPATKKIFDEYIFVKL